MKILIALLCSIVLRTQAQNWDEMVDVPVNLAFPVVVELNGYIHVMGGGTAQGATDYHARYDPQNNTWQQLADVPYLAQQPAGASVNGKIHYCGGGYPNSGTPLADHYYYDPSLDEWFEVASLPTARVIHEAVSLNGKLYVLSGQPDKDRFDVYDPVADSWTQLNDLPDLNFWYGVIVANNSTIYRFGGGGYLAPQDLAHRYDVANDAWISIPDLPQGLHAPAGVFVNETLICISGGYNVTETEETWLYNTATEEYTTSDELPAARSYHSMALAQNCLYSIGGNNLNIDSLGVDMLQNCGIFETPVIELTQQQTKPYIFNSTNNLVTISLRNQYSNLPLAIRMVDMGGKTVFDKTFSSAKENIQIESNTFDSGVYLVMLLIGENTFIENWTIVR